MSTALTLDVKRELDQLKNPPCISYVREQRDVNLKIVIPQKAFVTWRTLKSKFPNLSYQELLVYSSTNLLFELKTTERLETALTVTTSRVFAEVKGSKGYKRQLLLKKTRSIVIYPEELVNPSSLRRRSEELQREVDDLNEKLEKTENRCAALAADIVQFKQEQDNANDKISSLERQIDEYLSQNSELRSYINCLEDDFEKDMSLQNEGKDYASCCPRQKKRKLKKLASHAEKVLWFADSFGLKIESLVLSEKENPQSSMKIPLGEASGGRRKKSNYNNLPETEKDKIRATLFIMDKFCVSDAAYHEFTMNDQDKQRSYLVKQCRGKLNKCFHISRTPGKEPGIQMNFKEELRYQLQQQMTKEEFSKAQIRISGDGAMMSRISSFIVLSFTLLGYEEAVMSAFGNHVFAIVSGKEDYNVIKKSCSETFKDINDLIKEKNIDVDGKKIPLEFYLSGDYKFLLLVTGMNAANSTYACIYCKVAKSDRWDMSKSENHYWGDGHVRTIEEMREMSHKSKDNFGCINPPLLNIALSNIRVDELHLLLRITDVLESNLIQSSIEWDNRDSVTKSAPQNHLNNSVHAFNQCGVTFAVWRKKDETNKKTGIYDWTSLVGTAKKKVLSKLPTHMNKELLGDNYLTVKQVWKDFKSLYDIINTWDPTPDMKNNFFTQAKNWINLYLSLGNEELYYGKATITPYMHMLVYHVPKFLHQDFALKRFTGQGIEKINDRVRSIYHQKSNKHDACSEALLTLKRMDRLQEYERKVHNHTKRNLDYWDSEISQQRKMRKRVSVDPREDTENDSALANCSDIDINSLDATKLRKKLSELGLKTKVRNIEKLRKMLRDKLNEDNIAE